MPQLMVNPLDGQTNGRMATAYTTSMFAARLGVTPLDIRQDHSRQKTGVPLLS